MKNKISRLLLIAGSMFLATGFLLTLITPPTQALPPNHPPLPRQSTTLADFFFGGTQPNQMVDPLLPPSNCQQCHADYSDTLDQPSDYEPWTGWQGSMMAHSARDPLFYAALDIANADVPGAGEYCLRCHAPNGWLNGRSATTDGTALTAEDQEGITCAVCHRMVDPEANSENPSRDTAVFQTLTSTVSTIGSAALIIDPLDHRRGPFDLTTTLDFDPHQALGAESTLPSPHHQESSFCGSCHDINNPLFSWDPSSQSYIPNPDNQVADPETMFPVERTYSEWLLSDYNSPTGVHAPAFGGAVSTCQDCHMQDVSGVGGVFFGNPAPSRDDLPLHDLTGANTWVPQLLPLHPEFGDLYSNDPKRMAAIKSGIERARAMLQRAATLSVAHAENNLTVTVINESGHKLPTGYIEGRRMWLQIEGYDEDGNLVFTSGAYSQETATLEGYGTDPTLKVYEAHHGLTEAWAQEVGLPAGKSFHFMLNNQILFDNRIPPRGYNFEQFAAAGAAPYSDGEPDSTRYANGQYWDITTYSLPDNVAYGTVRLMHQIASREYIEFLRDNNPNPDGNRGDVMYELWETADFSPPETMVEQWFGLPEIYLPMIRTP